MIMHIPRRYQLLTPIILGALLIFLSACDGADAVVSAEAEVRPVEIVAVSGGMSARVLPGRVLASTTTELAFQVPGQMQASNLRAGQLVAAGEVLARLDPTDYQLSVREARALVQRLVTERDRKQILRDDDILAGAAWEQLEADIELAQVALDVAERRLEQTRLRAPFAGRISQRLVDSYASVAGGQPILLLQDTATLDVAIHVPSSMAAELRLGEHVAVTATGPGRAADPVALVYREHATAADPSTGTFRVVFRGDAADAPDWLPGMPVEVTLPTASDGLGASRVPVTALQADAGGGHFLWRVIDDEGRIEKLPVRVAQLQAEMVTLEHALPEGTRVVAAGARLLRADQRVRPLAY